MCWAGAFDVYLENRLYNFVDNLVEVFLLDATEATQDVTLDITGYNLALHEAGLREGEAIDHIITQRIRILWVKPVVRSNKHEIEHAFLVFLQLIVADDDGRMGFKCAVGKEEADFYDVSLVVLHRYRAMMGAMLLRECSRAASLSSR